MPLLTQTDHVRHLTQEQTATILEMCQWSARLFDLTIEQALSHLEAFPDEPLTYSQNYRMLRDQEPYRMLEAGMAQQTMRMAHSAMSTYVKLMEKAERGEYPHDLLAPPQTKGEGALFPLTIPVNVISVKSGGVLRLPVSRPFRRAHPGMSNVFMHLAPHVLEHEIRQARIRMLPITHDVWLDVTYRTDETLATGPRPHVMGIDLGVNNLVAAVTTAGTSLLVDGRRIKSVNHRYNERMRQARRDVVASTGRLQETRVIATATQARERKLRDAFHKAAAAVVAHCEEHAVGTIVCGCTRHMADTTPPWMQNFAELPMVRLMDAIGSACAIHGIAFAEQEDAYTSRASFMDDDPVPDADVQDNGRLKFAGKRVHRGLYRTRDGLLVNADLNAAANVLSKMARQQHQALDMESIARALVAQPQVIRI